MTNNNITVGFGLASIRTEQFALIDSNYDADKSVEYAINFSSAKVDEEKTLSVLFSVRFEQEEQPFIILDVSCHFKIENDSWENFKIKDEKALLIPRGFITHLCVLTVGTARGVLHTKTEGSNFNGFILPTLNLTEIITEDARIE